MAKLNTKANLDKPDIFYAELLHAHQGLSRQQSELLNARLILTLANHIGEHPILSEAIKIVKLEQSE